VTDADKFLRKPRNYAFRASVGFGRNTLEKWRDLGNSHFSVLVKPAIA
jgi:hypothetical protein